MNQVLAPETSANQVPIPETGANQVPPPKTGANQVPAFETDANLNNSYAGSNAQFCMTNELMECKTCICKKK